MDARDIMTKDVVTLTRDMQVDEAADILLRYRIHGAPVVDSAGHLIGMVSLVDLVGRTGSAIPDVMSADPVTAAEDTPAHELARLMLEQIVRRVPIVSAGRVVGIVSASDLLRVYLDLHQQLAVVPQGSAKRVRRKQAEVKSGN